MTKQEFESADDEQQLLIQAGSGQVSIQQFQHIYNLITGKSEEITKNSAKAIRLDVDDLVQLDTKIQQMLEQFNLVGQTASYTCYYDNGEKEVFSSCERFSLQAGSSNQTTESIYFKYRFAILLPQLKKPQNYTVTIRALNRLEALKKMLRGAPMGMPRGMINFFNAKTIELKVEYIDFAVSRSLMATLDGWLNSLDETPETPILKLLRSISHYFAPALQYTGLIFLTIGLMNQLPAIFTNIDDYAGLSKYLILIALTYFGTWKLLGALGHWVENAVDSTFEISYINITRGDEKAKQAACKSNKLDIIKAALGGAISGTASILVKYLALIIR